MGATTSSPEDDSTPARGLGASDGACAFQVRDHQETVEIDVAGELDLASAPELGRLLSAHDDHARIIVDLAGCSFIDSTAVNVLASAHRRAAADGGPFLLLRSPQGAVRRVFEVCGLDQVLSIEHAAPSRSRPNGA